MAMEVTRVNVWAGSIADQPGGLATALAVLSMAGVDLEFVIARRDTIGQGVVFVAPIAGAKQVRAAKQAGLTKADSLGSLRVSAPNKVGLCSDITQKLAAEGINLRGYSAAAIGRQAVVYLAFDNPADSATAARVLKSAAIQSTLGKERTMKTTVKKKAPAKKAAAKKTVKKKATAKKKAAAKKKAPAKKAAAKKKAPAKKRAAPKKKA